MFALRIIPLAFIIAVAFILGAFAGGAFAVGGELDWYDSGGQRDRFDQLMQAFEDGDIDPRMIVPTRFAWCGDDTADLCAIEWHVVGRRMSP